MRKDAVSLIRMSIRDRPLDDAQLAFVLSHYGHSAGKTKAARYRMLKRGEIRFSRHCRLNGRGQASKQWELDPNCREGTPRAHG